MPDTLGRITVPTVTNSGQTFPLTTQYPFGFSVERPVIVHRFGSLDAKQEQRYYVGIGPRKFQFKRPNLGWTEANQLKAFWESMQGSWQAFTYTVPNPDGSTTGVLVTFEQVPISFEYLRNAVQVGLNLIEVVDPTAAPTYSVSSTCTRFPSSPLSTALLSEVQQIIPLVHIRVRESAVPDIYLSDRRVTIGSQLYLPRVTGIGEPGSDVLIAQDGSGKNTRAPRTTSASPSATATAVVARNADATRQQHGSEVRRDRPQPLPRQLRHPSATVVRRHPELHQRRHADLPGDLFGRILPDHEPVPGAATQPPVLEDLQRWRELPVGHEGPQFRGGHRSGRRSHELRLLPRIGERMPGSRYVAILRGATGRSAGVVIKDDSTGFLGFGRNTVTATSIISDTVWGLALPEIWCNSGGNPLFAFMASALMVDYRDESGYADSLGLLPCLRHDRGRDPEGVSLPRTGRLSRGIQVLRGHTGKDVHERMITERKKIDAEAKFEGFGEIKAFIGKPLSSAKGRSRTSLGAMRPYRGAIAAGVK